MIKTIFLVFLVILITLACSNKSTYQNYLTNIKPLNQTAFIRLPLGSIKPSGWLKDQLTAQRNGLTGHLDEFWTDLIHSAWKGGDGEAWERSPYYLDGLVPLAYLLEDEALIKKVVEWIEPILNSSQPNGWFGPGINSDRWPLAVALKVLTQYYEVTRDSRALKTIQNYFIYLHDNPPDWPDDSWRGVRAMEHAVTGYWLFRQTHDPSILETVESIFKNSFDWTSYFEKFPWDSSAVADGKIPHNWKADGLTAHVVNNAMAVKYPGLWYQQSKNERYKNAVFQAIKKYDKHHGQVGGRFSGDEHLSGKRPTQGTELCAIVEYMFSLENLIEILGDPHLADRLEMLAYNALPGTFTPDCWAHQYDQQANQVLVTKTNRNWSTNDDASNIYGLMPNCPCCLANMHPGWPNFVQHLWMATHDQGLAVLAYGPCSVAANVGNGIEVKILEETDYPFDGEIQLKIGIAQPATFPIYLRIPHWADSFSVECNGKQITTKQSDFMLKLENRWKDGDVINIQFPLTIRTETRFNNSAAILRGPLYFALRINKKYDKIQLQDKNFYSINYLGSVDFEIRPISAWNYGLAIDRLHPENDILIQQNPIQSLPFADRGELIFSQEDLKYVKWQHDAPVLLKVKGRKIPGWQLKNNSADDPPRSPVKSEEKDEELILVPYGCARLRISEFPVVSDE